MRILLVHTHAALIGGAERYLESLLPELSRRGHQLALLFEHPVPEGAVGICPPGVDVDLFWTGHGGDDLSAALAWKPDVFYNQGAIDPALEAELLLRLPSAIFVHDYQRTCPTGTKSFARPSVSICQRPAGPGCLWTHYPRGCGGLNPLTMIRRYRAQQRSAGLLREYQAVLVASQWMRDEVAAQGVEPKRIEVLAPPSGVVPMVSPPECRAPSGRLLFMGRLAPSKGCSVLIDAVALLRRQGELPCELTIAGTGPDEAALREQARAKGLPVEFAGWVDAIPRARLLRQADLLVMPSLWPEPFGLAGLEAAAFGVPSVAFDVGGIRDWLTPGLNGELALAHPPTAQSLAIALTRALGDLTHFNQLRRRAWELSLTGHVRTHAARLELVLESAAAGRDVPA